MQMINFKIKTNRDNLADYKDIKVIEILIMMTFCFKREGVKNKNNWRRFTYHVWMLPR